MLPNPGVMVTPTSAYVPSLLKGMTIHPEDPLKFDFIIDNGNSGLENDELKKESNRLIKYFLASLTVPKDELWVNLSPNEKDRIIPNALGQTDLGRDLLAQDYILKQLTASLMYPENELGKKFWDKVYKEAYEKYSTTDIPVDTFNKVWIIPESASVYENGNTVFIVDSKLKVLLEQDYLSLERSKATTTSEKKDALATEIIREIIIPAITKEVNEGANFALLRQIYNSLILAKWYKDTIKNSILSNVYVDKNKTAGINNDDPKMKEKIYEQYMQAYKKGVYNYIKDEYDPSTKDIIPRKYFSGGFKGSALKVNPVKISLDKAMAVGDFTIVTTDLREKTDKALISDAAKFIGAVIGVEAVCLVVWYALDYYLDYYSKKNVQNKIVKYKNENRDVVKEIAAIVPEKLYQLNRFKVIGSLLLDVADLKNRGFSSVIEYRKFEGSMGENSFDDSKKHQNKYFSYPLVEEKFNVVKGSALKEGQPLITLKVMNPSDSDLPKKYTDKAMLNELGAIAAFVCLLHAIDKTSLKRFKTGKRYPNSFYAAVFASAVVLFPILIEGERENARNLPAIFEIVRDNTLFVAIPVILFSCMVFYRHSIFWARRVLDKPWKYKDRKIIEAINIIVEDNLRTNKDIERIYRLILSGDNVQYAFYAIRNLGGSISKKVVSIKEKIEKDVKESTSRENPYNKNKKVFEFLPKALMLIDQGFDFRIIHIKEEGHFRGRSIGVHKRTMRKKVLYDEGELEFLGENDWIVTREEKIDIVKGDKLIKPNSSITKKVEGKVLKKFWALSESMGWGGNVNYRLRKEELAKAKRLEAEDGDFNIYVDGDPEIIEVRQLTGHPLEKLFIYEIKINPIEKNKKKPTSGFQVLRDARKLEHDGFLNEALIEYKKALNEIKISKLQKILRKDSFDIFRSIRRIKGLQASVRDPDDIMSYRMYFNDKTNKEIVLSVDGRKSDLILNPDLNLKIVVIKVVDSKRGKFDHKFLMVVLKRNTDKTYTIVADAKLNFDHGVMGNPVNRTFVKNHSYMQRAITLLLVSRAIDGWVSSSASSKDDQKMYERINTDVDRFNCSYNKEENLWIVSLSEKDRKFFGLSGDKGALINRTKKDNKKFLNRTHSREKDMAMSSSDANIVSLAIMGNGNFAGNYDVLGETLPEVLENFYIGSDDEVREEVFDGIDKLKSIFRVFVNGKKVDPLDDIPLNRSSEIKIFQVFNGGGDKAMIGGEAVFVALVASLYSVFYKNDKVFFAAAKKGDLKVLQKFIDKGSDVNRFSPLGLTALNLAVYYGQYEYAELLLKNHANPNLGKAFKNKIIDVNLRKDPHMSQTLVNLSEAPLITAIMKKDAKMVQLLLKYNADPNLPIGEKGKIYPLFVAAGLGELDIVQALIENGAKINIGDLLTKVTPIMCACKHKNYDVAEFLLEQKADIILKDNDGLTAKDYLLGDKGADYRRFETILEEKIVQQSAKKQVEKEDSAMAVQYKAAYDIRTTNYDPGGIDMNKIEVDRKGNVGDIKFKLEDVNNILSPYFEGFEPVIINITPINNILPLLGLDDSEKNKDQNAISKNKYLIAKEPNEKV